MSKYDVVIVGGGAAGLSAALVLTRARRRVAVVDTGAPRNAPAAHMQGFLGSDGMPPAMLLQRGRDEVASYGGHLLHGAVAEISKRTQPGQSDNPSFTLTLSDGKTLSSRRVLVATGLRDEVPDIPGVRERWGRDLLHCPYCHGYEVRDQPIGVLGGNAGSVQHALLIRQWSADIVYFTNDVSLSEAEREQLLARGIETVDGHVCRLVIEEDRLVGVELDSARIVARTAVFVRPNLIPNADLLVNIGCATDEVGWVVADGDGRTSTSGVWVAGNVSNPRAQVVTATGEGSATAIAINAELVEEDITTAIDVLRRNTSTQYSQESVTTQRINP